MQTILAISNVVVAAINVVVAYINFRNAKRNLEIYRKRSML